MGRKQIVIQRIQNERQRYLCFQKRKKGLLKKAVELSKLTDCQVIITIIDSKGEIVNTYKSFQGPIEEQMRKVTEHHSIQSNDLFEEDSDQSKQVMSQKMIDNAVQKGKIQISKGLQAQWNSTEFVKSQLLIEKSNKVKHSKPKPFTLTDSKCSVIENSTITENDEESFKADVKMEEIESPAELMFSKVQLFKDIRSTAPSSSFKPSHALKRPRECTEPILDYNVNRRPKMHYDSSQPSLFQTAQEKTINDPSSIDFVPRNLKQQPMAQNSSNLNPNEMQAETQGVVDQVLHTSSGIQISFTCKIDASTLLQSQQQVTTQNEPNRFERERPQEKPAPKFTRNHTTSEHNNFILQPLQQSQFLHPSSTGAEGQIPDRRFSFYNDLMNADDNAKDPHANLVTSPLGVSKDRQKDPHQDDMARMSSINFIQHAKEMQKSSNSAHL